MCWLLRHFKRVQVPEFQRPVTWWSVPENVKCVPYELVNAGRIKPGSPELPYWRFTFAGGRSSKVQNPAAMKSLNLLAKDSTQNARAGLPND